MESIAPVKGNGRKLNVPLPKVAGMKVQVWIRSSTIISEDIERGIEPEVWYYATLTDVRDDVLTQGYRVDIRGYETFLCFSQCILIRSCSIKDTMNPCKIRRAAKVAKALKDSKVRKLLEIPKQN